MIVTRFHKVSKGRKAAVFNQPRSQYSLLLRRREPWEKVFALGTGLRHRAGCFGVGRGPGRRSGSLWRLDQYRKSHMKSLWLLRDGSLENLWGGGRSTKKIFAQGKIKWKKIHARQLILKNIPAMAEKKFIQGRKKISAARKFPSPP